MMTLNTAEQIRILCARLNISQAELARRTGKSPQGFSAKMKRGSFTVAELEEIADATGMAFKHNFVFPDGEEL